MSEDISKRTITILVILTVIISVLGTLSVMSAINDMKKSNNLQKTKSTSNGKVGLTVEGEPETKEPISVTGRVGLTITSQPENSSEETQEEGNSYVNYQNNQEQEYDIPLPE